MIRRFALLVGFVFLASSLAAQSLPIPVLPGEAKPIEDSLKKATEAFRKAKDGEPRQFRTARDLFKQAKSDGSAFTAEQSAAWVYSRIRVAADLLNQSSDAGTAKEVLLEVEEALALVPDHKGLNDAAKDLLAAARKRIGGAAKTEPAKSSFRVSCPARTSFADDVAKAADTLREEISRKWSGPTGGAWGTPCEIVIHATAVEFAAATKLSKTATGLSEAKLKNGTIASRRIDLRFDDDTLLDVALPRELTHLVLADLFPNQPPPTWAEVGMAVLSTSETERDRYLKTIRRCAKDGELLAVSAVLSADEVPSKSVTAYHVESASLVQYLVDWKGEKAFTGFVRDAQRYGVDTALNRQYGMKDSKVLEDNWLKGVRPAVK